MEMDKNLSSNLVSSPTQENISQQPPLANQNEPPKPTGIKRSGIIVLACAIFAVLLVVAVGGYFLSTKNKLVETQYSPTRTAVTPQASVTPNGLNNWKTHTYRGDSISYSFQYPSDWVVIDGSGTDADENSPTIGLEAKDVKDFSSVGYGMYLNSPSITVEDLGYYHKNSTTGIDPSGSYASIDNLITSIKNSHNDKIFEEKTVTIGDKSFKKISRGYPNPAKYEYLISYPNSSLFVAISTPITNKELNSGEKINNLEIVEKVLSTFKFL